MSVVTKPAQRDWPFKKAAQKVGALESLRDVEPTHTEDMELVDLALSCTQQIEAIRKEGGLDKLEAQLDKIKTHFASLAKESDGSEEAEFVGAVGKMVFSKASAKVELVDKVGLIHALTPSVYAELATFKVTDLRKYLTGIELEKLTQEVAGPRRLLSITKR